MSAAAPAKSKTNELWTILSLDKGFYTAHGWDRDPAFAVLLTKTEADEFIVAHADDTVLAMRYDGMAHGEIRVIDQGKIGSVIHHDLHRVALDALCKLKSCGADEMPVEVVHHNIGIVPEDHLTGLARRVIGEMHRRPDEFTRKFECALQRFDAALAAFRDRVKAHDSWQRAVQP